MKRVIIPFGISVCSKKHARFLALANFLYDFIDSDSKRGFTRVIDRKEKRKEKANEGRMKYIEGRTN